MKMNALWEIVQTRLVRRGVAVKNFKVGESEPAAGGTVRRVIDIQQGIPIEAAREIVKFIKDKKLKKVQAAIQADQVRVSSPSKDELQDAMRRCASTTSASRCSSATTGKLPTCTSHFFSFFSSHSTAVAFSGSSSRICSDRRSVFRSIGTRTS